MSESANYPQIPFHAYNWTDEERAFLSNYVTNTDLPVFVLYNLPEATKGALFARYSRTHKDLRRLMIDEFYDDLAAPDNISYPYRTTDTRAGRLYDRVLDTFGDDSIAQLGSAHIACEQVSNIMTKILERGRLMSYLEQSTRYIAYDSKLKDKWRYRMPPDLPENLIAPYESSMDTMFKAYAECIRSVMAYLKDAYIMPEGTSETAWAAALKAEALDASRGLLPASTISNLGIHGSGQAYEHLLLRLLGHPLEEARQYGNMMLTELRKIVPEFLSRVDQPSYGGAAIKYKTERAEALRSTAEQMSENIIVNLLPQQEPDKGQRVFLIDYDPHAEIRIAAAALAPYSRHSEVVLREMLENSSESDIDRVYDAIRGDRQNRRHRPGRELELSDYRFVIEGDYGAYRDLQRHRMQTIEAQPLSTDLGYITPQLIIDSGLEYKWDQAMEESDALYTKIAEASPPQAPYCVAMAYRMRYTMSFNAREAMHMLELRSQPSGHPSYRWIVQEMLRQIKDIADHKRIESLFTYMDHSDATMGRLASEQRAERRRRERELTS